MSQSAEMKIMGWDSEFFMPKSGASKNNAEPGKENPENKFVRCAGCNELISVVSTTLYEIDNKHYCSECYSRKTIRSAVERDHTNLQQEKMPVQR